MKNKLSAAIACVLLSAAAQCAYAQDAGDAQREDKKDDATNLDRMIVTGTRAPKAVDKIPGAVTVVSPEETWVQVQNAFIAALEADGKAWLLDDAGFAEQLADGQVPDNDDRVPMLLAVSDNGEIDGKFTQLDPLFTGDGGHGMLFRTACGKTMLTLHSPNSHLNERPCFFEL